MQPVDLWNENELAERNKLHANVFIFVFLVKNDFFFFGSLAYKCVIPPKKSVLSLLQRFSNVGA